MRIAICEDEHIYLELLRNKVKEYFSERKVSIYADSFSDAMLLPGKINEGRNYDLIFMDLHMKNSDGMEIAKKLKERGVDTPVVFVTGIENRVYQGYSVDAFDYILKRDMDQRLPEVLDRFMKSYKKNVIVISDREGRTAVVKAHEILWVESDGRGSRIVTQAEKISAFIPIGKVAEMLPIGAFVEAYKSIFVNISEIKRVGNDMVVMSDDSELPLSRRKRNDVLNAVLSRMKGL